MNLIEKAQSPFLFSSDGALKVLVVKCTGTRAFSDDELAAQFFVFRSPQASTPALEEMRQQIRAQFRRKSIRKTFTVDAATGAQTITPIAGDSVSDHSSVMVDGQMQTACESKGRMVVLSSGGEVITPDWASAAYVGWSSSKYEAVWLCNDAIPTIGIQVEEGYKAYTFSASAARFSLYRIIPVDGNPDQAVVSFSAQGSGCRSFLISLVDHNFLFEILVDGKPVQDASISGDQCAYSDGSSVKIAPFTLSAVLDVAIKETQRTPPPNGFEVLKNFSDSMTKWMKAGFPVVSKNVFESRMAICRACPHWLPKARMHLGKCNVCGCTAVKQWLGSLSCPQGKW